MMRCDTSEYVCDMMRCDTRDYVCRDFQNSLFLPVMCLTSH